MAHYLKRKNRDQKGKKDLIIMCIIAVILIFALAYFLIKIVRQSEKHVEKVRNTKVQYQESLSWRPDKNLCEKRILEDLEENPDKTKAKYTELELSEEAMATIGKMKKLTELELRHSVFNDRWLKYIEKLPLTALDVYGTKITDKGIPFILKLKKLKSLEIGDTALTDEGLKLLSTHPNLIVLDINATKVTDDGIKVLADKKNLINLSIADTKATSKCLQSIAQMKRLRRFNSGGIPLDSEDIEKLSSLKNLKTLAVGDCGLDDSDIKVLKNFPSITHLNLSNNRVTDRGLLSLVPLTKIRTLELKGCRNISQEAVKEYKKKNPRCRVKYSKIKSDIPEEIPIDVFEEEVKALEKKYLKKDQKKN